MKLNYIVTSTKYKNLKELLKAHFHISERLLLKLKRHHKIFINGIPAFVHSPLHLNDSILIDISFQEYSSNIHPNTQLKLDIIFEDETMLIINKPAGFPVHPSMAHFCDSLSNGVQAYFEKNNIHTKIRPVNRLDKDTSGLVIFAKNEYIQECLIHQMANRSFEKYYLALLSGVLDFSNKTGTIDANISRKSDSIIEREINSNGQKAITHYQLIQNYTNYCLVKFQLETGRTHQIRVHTKYIGHPILGDSLYATPSELISRQALHAYKISFIHPITNQKMIFETEIPKDMQCLISPKRK